MTNFNNEFLVYALLFLVSIIISFISPHGILKSIFTVFFMFIATFGIQTAVIAINPLLSTAAKYGKRHLEKSKLLDKGSINTDIIDGGSMSTLMIVGGFLQIFVLNYFIQRYTGVQILDSYIIIFWSLLQIGIRFVNYFLKYKNGEKLQNINLITNVFDVTDNQGKPKINIIISGIVVLTMIFILKNNPTIVETPEIYLEQAEDMIFGVFLPDTKIQKYKVIV